MDIVLHPPDNYSYKLKIVGMPGKEEEGVLALDKEKLSFLSLESTEVGDHKYPVWEQHLRHVGEELGKEILESNYAFAVKFHEYLGMVEEKNVTIRFVVERDFHPIVLEALKEAGQQYWMLRVPIYRRVKEPTNRYALYQDEETRESPINCIIIQADVE